MAEFLVSVTVLLAVASATLAIASFVFGWVSFRNTAQMQIEIQAILSKLSERVDVVAQRTSGQMDKAWEYFTNLPSPPGAPGADELAEREEELRALIVQEARQEAANVIEKAGLDEDALQGLLKQMESVIEKSAERTTVLSAEQEFLRELNQVELQARLLAAQVEIGVDPRAPLDEVVEGLRGLLPDDAWDILARVMQYRAKAAHGTLKLSERALRSNLRRAVALNDFLRTFGPD
jgi:hypothetical protein